MFHKIHVWVYNSWQLCNLWTLRSVHRRAVDRNIPWNTYNRSLISAHMYDSWLPYSFSAVAVRDLHVQKLVEPMWTVQQNWYGEACTQDDVSGTYIVWAGDLRWKSVHFNWLDVIHTARTREWHWLVQAPIQIPELPPKNGERRFPTTNHDGDQAILFICWLIQIRMKPTQKPKRLPKSVQTNSFTSLLSILLTFLLYVIDFSLG
jgi:hypothetical protein